MKIRKVTCSIGLSAIMLIWTGCSSGEKPAATDKSKQSSSQPTGNNNARSSRPSMAGGNMENREQSTGSKEGRERREDPRSNADVSSDSDSARRGAAKNANKNARGSAGNRGDANSGRGSTASDSRSTAKKRASAAPPKTKLVAAFPSGNGSVGLGAGDLVPEITGEDLEGTAFKLSDYKGKVIMLDFWGDW
ncbi:MAG: hypothetical protein P8J33_05200 [Pirellulaceae bacterium]|nr:hypothetical protein [Pirellulaceae bacterium]